MTLNLDEALVGTLGPGHPQSFEELEEWFIAHDKQSHQSVETEYWRAGWYSGNAEPYPEPDVEFDAPVPADPVLVRAERRLWLARYNPADPNFTVSGINDEAAFPWRHPEMAPFDGWWLSSYQTPADRPAIAEITTGDVVICQRTDPGAQLRDPGDPMRTDMLVGACVVERTRAWTDINTSTREHEACL